MSDFDKKKTGEILREYIVREMSQVELAKKIGVSPQYINNIINGLKSPSENFLNKFFEIIKVKDEDKNKILENEKIKKLPSTNYKEKIVIRNDNSEFKRNVNSYNNVNSSNISLLGLFNENGFFRYYENEEKKVFPKLPTDEKLLFFIKIKCTNYFPLFSVEDTIIFKKVFNVNEETLYEINKKICLIEYRGKIDIKKIEYLDKIIILSDIVNNEITDIINLEDVYKLKIIGNLYAQFKLYY